MTQIRSSAHRSSLMLVVTAGLFAAVSVLFAGAASAQSVDCPAGARGGAGGNAGRSSGGTGGLGFTVGGFATTGSADASGANGGSARGGTGGRGGSGTLPVCNQNTNGGGAVRTVTGGGGSGTGGTGGGGTGGGGTGSGGGGTGGGGGPRYGSGGGLARTGAQSGTEIGIAGLAFVIGGMLLFAAQPVRRLRTR